MENGSETAVASFARSHLLFAKVVATPTEVAWSQAYSAGSLFAVLSLTKSQENQADLAAIGRQVLETFEREYFTLEEKDLASVKGTIQTTSTVIPEGIQSSLAVASIVPSEQTVLYVFGQQGAVALLKRGEKLASLLQHTEEITTASGFLESGDTLVLATKQFAALIPVEKLAATLNHHPPIDVAETLTPLLHDKEDGAAASIIVSYNEPTSEAATDAKASTTNKTTPLFPLATLLQARLSPILQKVLLLRQNLKHPQRVFLTVAVVLVVVLGTSIFFAVSKQQEGARQALFTTTFREAKTRYEEGQAVVNLNRQVAKESFEAAKEQLIKLREDLPVDAKEREEVEQLLAKVEEGIMNVSGVSHSNAVKVDSKESALLDQQRKTPSYHLFAQNETTIYFASNTEIASLTKASGKTATVIANKDFWTDAVGLSTYNQNVYVLDKKTSKVIKFVPQEKGYSNLNYFASGIAPNLANAVSMAIDTSVWILLSDGTVLKFTRGKPDTFVLSGLDKPLANPTKIFTSTDTKAIYILDRDNSRIVVFEKNGTYKAQYQAEEIGKAKDFDVVEKDKKIFILANDQVFAIAI